MPLSRRNRFGTCEVVIAVGIAQAESTPERSITQPIETCDVLVIGLGPAGASAAAEAAVQGARVIAVDRKINAGVPVQCAEFVPRMLGMEIADLACARRQDIASMATFLDAGLPDVEPHFPGMMIDRAAFDAKLVANACALGAQCRFNTKLHTFSADGSAQFSDGTTITATVVIGADGPRSRVGSAVGAPNTELVETRQITVPLLCPHNSTDIFLSSDIPGGYAWLFPKGDLANLGLGVAPQWRAELKPLLEKLHAQLRDEGRVGDEVSGYTGGAIPVGGMRRLVSQIAETTVLLAGDAAGLTNPVTGAGIAAAVISGRAAGAAAASLICKNASAADEYSDEMESLFGPSLARALARRRALMAIYKSGVVPGRNELKRSWIAFPEYWAA